VRKINSYYPHCGYCNFIAQYFASNRLQALYSTTPSDEQTATLRQQDALVRLSRLRVAQVTTVNNGAALGGDNDKNGYAVVGVPVLMRIIRQEWLTSQRRGFRADARFFGFFFSRYFSAGSMTFAGMSANRSSIPLYFCSSRTHGYSVQCSYIL
jgi:hypothetical protein